MSTLPFNAFYWLLALSPIIVVLILMVGLGWGGSKAGPAGWLAAVIVSLAFFGATPRVVAYSQLRGLLLTAYVLYIIWMALVLYNVVDEAGAITRIGRAISRLTEDRVMQLLILSWAFSAFLQGVAGFGVPIAVVAPLLIGLGFPPVTSVVAVAAGHSWSVTFGDMASSFNALIVVTELDGQALVRSSAGLLGVACLGCGTAALYAHDKFRSVRRGALAIALIGTVMAVTQYGLAVSGLWNLAGFGAGLAGLGATVLVSRLGAYRTTQSPETVSDTSPADRQDQRSMSPILAMAAYILLVVVVSLVELVSPVHQALNAISIKLAFPRTETAMGWVTKGGLGKKINVFGHPGALLAYTSVGAYALYHFTGHYETDALKRVIGSTVQSALPSSIGIAWMVGLAMIMDQTGMTYLIAVGLSEALGSAFPFVAPFIGLLGAFVTGSNTNSNVMFAGLQQQTSELLALPALVIAGAQTTGGSLGSMLAPAKIIVGCSTAGLAGEEGAVLRQTIVYGLVITAVIGLLTWLKVRFT